MKVWNQVPSFDEIKDLYPTIKKAFFDLDGTLINSETIHMKITQKVLKEKAGVDETVEFLESVFYGKSATDCYHYLKENYEQFNASLEEFLIAGNATAAQALSELVSQNKLFEPAILKLLDAMKADSWEIAIVTASERDFLDCVLKNLNDNYFSFTLCASDTKRTKPHPDPYLKAIELMGNSDPKDYIIFEDSPTGLMSANASGAIVNKACWFNNV